MEEEGYGKRPPGLRYNGERPIWRASKAAVAAGYPVKSVNLSSLIDNDRLLNERCVKLQREMLEWLTRGERKAIIFDGTFKTLLDLYQTDPKSPYHRLKRSSRKPYDVYIRMMRTQIGHCFINRSDGRDALDWFDEWAAPEKAGGRRMLAKAIMAISVLKAALTYGIMCRLPGCSEFKEVLSACTFETLPPRTATVNADQIIAARKAAHAADHPGLALSLAIQFEAIVRQWDVVGYWEPISEPKPSAIISKGAKWFGPTWQHVDQNLILRYTPSKTDRTTGEEIVIDLRACPMVMEELALMPDAERTGPLIKDKKTGLPYRRERHAEAWHIARKAAGIPASVWNRDLRASGSTEARAAEAMIDDLKKVAGHSERSNTMATVYDRAKLEAHRRVVKARTAFRSGKSD